MPVKVETIDYRRLLRKRFSMLLAFIALVLASIVANQASGQEGDYVALAMPAKYADADKLKRMESKVNLALSDGSLTPEAENWKAAEEYYSTYFVFLMAQPDGGAKLTDATYLALRHLERASQSAAPAFRTAMLGWIKKRAELVAVGQIEGKYFSPTARINATLLLAHLDQKPSQGGQPPVPDLSVAGTLVKKLYENPEAPLGARVVALSGVRRQSVLLGPNMPDQLRQYYLLRAKELLEDKAPAGLEKASMDADAYAFLQRYAVDIIRALGEPGAQTWLADKLAAIVADKDASPVIALYAARNLSRLNEGIKELTVTPPTVIGWADRAAVAVANELERLKALDRPMPVTPQQSLAQASARTGASGMSGSYGPPAGYGMMPGGQSGSSDMSSSMMGDYGSMPGLSGGYGAMGGYGTGPMAANPQPPEVIASRRRINANLEALLLGLVGSLDPNKPGTGLMTAAKDAGKAQIEELLAALRTAADEVNNPMHDDRKKFIEMLETSSTTLNQWVERRRPAQEVQPAKPDVAVN